MKETMKVINAQGEETTAEVLLYFSLESTSKDYVLYTFGEVDEQQMETIHASIIERNADGYNLEAMPDEDWETVKELMREIIRNEEE